MFTVLVDSNSLRCLDFDTRQSRPSKILFVAPLLHLLQGIEHADPWRIALESRVAGPGLPNLAVYAPPNTGSSGSPAVAPHFMEAIEAQKPSASARLSTQRDCEDCDVRGCKSPPVFGKTLYNNTSSGPTVTLAFFIEFNSFFFLFLRRIPVEISKLTSINNGMYASYKQLDLCDRIQIQQIIPLCQCSCKDSGSGSFGNLNDEDLELA